MDLFKKYKRWKKRLNKTNRKLLYILRFLIVFNLFALPIYAIDYFNIDLFILEYIITKQVSLFLNIFGVDHSLSLLQIGSKMIPTIKIAELPTIAIDISCTAIRSMFAFLGLVFALPKVKFDKRVRALLWGLPTIYIVNLIRIVTTILVGVKFSVEALDIIHTLLWREGLILLIIVMWVFWIKNNKIKFDYS
jgi:exosortase/archaeosortase family protein